MNGIGYRMIDAELREALERSGWYFGYPKPYKPGSKPCYLPDYGNDYPLSEPQERDWDTEIKNRKMEALEA